MDMTNALLKLEAWLGYNPLADRRTIKIFDSFSNHKDLLFKSTTVGLKPKDSDIQTVVEYKNLFDNVESCRSSGVRVIFSNTLSLFASLGVILAMFLLNH